ncbi:MAG: MFS transporter [Nitrospiraceae bacterium]|nr:MFS transporter [Nitrospiraceae bacterium]
MNTRIRIELSVMMFLEFFIWGAWFVTMGTYLGKGLQFADGDIGSAYSTTGWAAILSPFFVGMIADRFFSAQKVLGVAHIIGGVILYYAATVTTPGLFFWVVLAYALCYMPTIALVNAIAFNQMKDAEKELPPIRVLGTIGWIVAGLLITLLGILGVKGIEATALPMKMAAGASILMGLYSFFLPKTPPKVGGKKVTIGDVLGLDAFKLMKDRSFAIFVLSSLLVSIPLAFYYSFANLFLNEVGMTGVAAKMSMGQMSEIVFMLVMPFFFARFGVKKMLLLGMLAWVVRYVLFAYGNPGSLVFMFYGGILLHGICYDFFFVTGQIYVDNEAPKEIRASAQGFLALVTYGVGMVIGNKIAGIVADHYKTLDEVTEAVGHLWTNIWLIPAAMAAIVVVLFALLFTEKKKATA